jgi:hypothetical protein
MESTLTIIFIRIPRRARTGRNRIFPDDPSWAKSDKRLSRADWRRENANQFIQKTYQAIKAEKPWVKFGISPFGIWRPGNPPQIKGFDQYEKLYADAHKWIANGWADYFAPQLILADRSARAKLSGVVELVERTEPQTPPHLAGSGDHEDGRRLEIRRDHPAGAHRRTTAGEFRAHPLQHETFWPQPHADDRAAIRPLSRCRVDPGNALACRRRSRSNRP